MNYRNHRSPPLRNLIKRDVLATLTASDFAVLNYLDKLTRNNKGEACTVSIPKIANACGISERQVQISTAKLINARLLKRVGYDFGNLNKAKRGSIYKVLVRGNS